MEQNLSGGGAFESGAALNRVDAVLGLAGREVFGPAAGADGMAEPVVMELLADGCAAALGGIGCTAGRSRTVVEVEGEVLVSAGIRGLRLERCCSSSDSCVSVEGWGCGTALLARRERRVNRIFKFDFSIFVRRTEIWIGTSA